VTPTERIDRIDAALALCGSAKRWVGRAFVSFLVMIAAGIALGMGAPAAVNWAGWAGAIAGGACMSFALVFYWRAEALRGAL
jgi:hypothetical protein